MIMEWTIIGTYLTVIVAIGAVLMWKMLKELKELELALEESRKIFEEMKS
jgi:uncharacterized membrane-anchored protein YhcB (DUF1043 family)